MAQLEEALKQIESLKKSGGGDGGGDGDMVAALQAEISKQREQLQNVVNGGDAGGGADNEELEKQKEQYAKKGMTLAEIESPAEPHFVNIDEGEWARVASAARRLVSLTAHLFWARRSVPLQALLLRAQGGLDGFRAQR